jgi:hypothetical protein
VVETASTHWTEHLASQSAAPDFKQIATRRSPRIWHYPSGRQNLARHPEDKAFFFFVPRSGIRMLFIVA